MNQKEYGEGQIYAVPLRSHGYGAVLVARKSIHEKIVLGYLFKIRFDVLPQYNDVELLTPKDAFIALRFGDLSIVNGDWILLGKLGNWNKTDWPFPAFARRDDMTRTAWKVIYADDDPTKIISEERIQYPGEFERDAMHGAGVIEILLTKTLDG